MCLLRQCVSGRFIHHGSISFRSSTTLASFTSPTFNTAHKRSAFNRSPNAAQVPLHCSSRLTNAGRCVASPNLQRHHPTPGQNSYTSPPSNSVHSFSHHPCPCHATEFLVCFIFPATRLPLIYRLFRPLNLTIEAALIPYNAIFLLSTKSPNPSF